MISEPQISHFPVASRLKHKRARKNVRALSQSLSIPNKLLTDFRKKIFLPSVQLVFDQADHKCLRPQLSWKKSESTQRDSPSAKLLFLLFRKTFSGWFVQLDFGSHFPKNRRRAAEMSPPTIESEKI